MIKKREQWGCVYSLEKGMFISCDGRSPLVINSKKFRKDFPFLLDVPDRIISLNRAGVEDLIVMLKDLLEDQ